MTDVSFTQLAYEQVVRVGKAIASPIRLELSVANTSQHLQILRQSRLVETATVVARTV